jgi:hypothetical protein
VPAAWALAAPLSAGRARVLPLAGGLAGLAAFAAWGLAIDAPAFLSDFVRDHVFARFVPGLRLARELEGAYPDVLGLWREFADHYGLAFTLAAAAGSVRAVASGRPVLRAAAAAVLLGAFAFSVTDWRQTKHLALLVPSALLALGTLAPAAAGPRRLFVGGLLLLALRNGWTAWPLLRDFEALRPSTIW